jgi:hypothetical protein
VVLSNAGVTITGCSEGNDTFQGQVIDFDSGETFINLAPGDEFFFTDLSQDGTFSVSDEQNGRTVLSVDDLEKGANISLIGSFSASDFEHVGSPYGYAILYSPH